MKLINSTYSNACAVVQVSFEENVYEVVEGGTANVTVRVDGIFTTPFNVIVIPSNGTATGIAVCTIYSI